MAISLTALLGSYEPMVRPQFGELHRADGTTIPLVFRSTSDPYTFEARRADDESEVEIGTGDSVSVDVIGPGQSVAFRTPS